jgi:hypothetical protein
VFLARKPHRQAARSPATGRPGEHARDSRAARLAATLGIQCVAVERVQVTLDQQRAALQRSRVGLARTRISDGDPSSFLAGGPGSSSLPMAGAERHSRSKREHGKQEMDRLDHGKVVDPHGAVTVRIAGKPRALSL